MQNLQYDVFISYPHALNEQKSDDGRGWVDHFFETLKIKFKLITGKDLKPWLDNEQLGCGDTLRKIESEGLGNTRFLIPILSPPYMYSKWCRREFLEFAKQAKKTNSLYIENACRILPIVFYPFEDVRLEEVREIKELNKIKSFMKPGTADEILYKKFYDDSFMKRYYVPTDKEFEPLCLEFAQILADKLKETENVQLDMVHNSPGIYLGLTSQTALDDRERVVNELKDLRKYEKHDFVVFPAESDLNYDAFRKMDLKEYNKTLSEYIDRSSVGMIILDERYGQTPEDSEKSYLELQYDLLASKAGKKDSDFRLWIYITDSEISDSRQKKLIAKINQHFEDFPDNIFKVNFRSIKELGETMITGLLQNEEMKHTGQAMEGAREHLMLLINSKDENSPIAQKLDDFIFEKEFEVRKPSFSKVKGHAEDFEKHLSDALEKCRKAIIFFGENATDEWCNAVKIDILKAINVKGSGIKNKAICITDPNVTSRIRKVRSHDFKAFNCEEEGFYQKIEQFLTA